MPSVKHRRRCARKSLRLETLEARCLLALGDLQHTLLEPNSLPEDFAHFGGAVAIAGDLIVVGAPWERAKGFSSAGRAYVFNAVTGNVVATLKNPIPGYGDQFGSSVAINGNLVVVGAPDDTSGYESIGSPTSGSAFVFNATTGELLQTLRNPFAESNEEFGVSVAIAGDNVLVGDPSYHADPASLVGAVHQFSAASGGLLRTHHNPTPEDGDEFGIAVTADGTRVLIGAPGDNDANAGALGAAYLFSTANGSLLKTFMNLDTASDDGYEAFGAAVGLSGNNVLVGNPQSDHFSATIVSGVGQAFVYDATTGNFLREFVTPDNESDGRFGQTLAVSGNVVAVGAPDTSGNAFPSAGQVHLFNVTTGQFLRTVASPAPNNYAQAGAAVAIAGERVVVGVPGEGSGVLPGRAYVFNHTTGNQLHVLNLPTRAGEFGTAVAVAGNVAVIGAHNTTAVSVNSGAAYLYNLDGTVRTRLTDPDITGLDDYDDFGYAVATNGTQVAVSAPDAYSEAENTGAVYIYDQNGVFQREFRAPDTDDVVHFGDAIAISGTRIVIASPFDDKVYVYNITTGVLLRTFVNPTPAFEDEFGYSVAIAGDTVVVGAPFDDTHGTDAGAAYVYDIATGGLQRILYSPTPSLRDYFGFSMSMSGGDNIVIGAPREDAGATDSGAVYLINANSGALLRTLTSPTPLLHQHFGHAVGYSGDQVVVGAPNDITGVDEAGRTYVYSATTGVVKKTIANPLSDEEGHFGAAVAITNQQMIVGGVFEIPESRNGGAAFLIDGDPNVSPTLTLSGSFSYTENAAAIKIASSATLSDPGQQNFGGGVLTVDIVTNSNANDRLEIQNQGTAAGQIGISGADVKFGNLKIGAFAGGTGSTPLTVSLNTSSSPAAVQALIRAITFRTLGEAPNTAQRTIRFRLTDGDGGASNAPTRKATVIAVNDAPVLSTAPNPVLDPMKEDGTNPAGTLVTNFAAAAITDPDPAPLKGIAITAAGGQATGRWQYSVNGGSTWLELGAPTENTARLLVSNAQTRVRYIPKPNFNGQVQLSYRAWDRTQGTAGGTLDTAGRRGGTKTFSTAVENATLTVTPVNDKPVLTLSGSLGYVRNAPAVVLAPTATVADIDSTNFDLGVLRVRITLGGGAANTLAIGSGFTVDASGNVKQGTTTIGKRLSNGIGTNELKIQFNTNATPSIVQAFVRSITFRSTGGSAGQRKIEFTVSDGDGGLSDVRTKTVNVT